MAVAGVHSVNTSGGDVEGGEQGGGAVADIIMGHAFHIAEAHRQHRLGTVEGLNLALLVDTEHQGLIGRVQVRPTMSRTFSTKNGSVESLKLRVRWGCTAKA